MIVKCLCKQSLVRVSRLLLLVEKLPMSSQRFREWPRGVSQILPADLHIKSHHDAHTTSMLSARTAHLGDDTGTPGASSLSSASVVKIAFRA